MFKFLLAFIVWLFATGEYSKWIALVQTSAAPAGGDKSTAGTSAPSATGTDSASTGGLGNVLGALGALGSLTNAANANSSASGTSTPADLISGYTGK